MSKHKYFLERQSKLKDWIEGRQPGVWCMSRNKVPYGLFATPETGQASVCYFGKTDIFRLFYPFCSSRQTKKDFKTVQEIDKYLEEVKVQGVKVYDR